MNPKILIVDDDDFTIKVLARLFRGKPVDISIAGSGSEARRLLGNNDYNLILMDQRLPDAKGLDLLREVRQSRPRQMAILITAFADARDAVRAVREGLFDYLIKPFENLEELEAVIEKGIEVDRAYREIDALRKNLNVRTDGPIFIGHAPAVEQMLRKVEQVAPLDTSVLIEGESGTGKEIVARIIHAHSFRNENRLIEVNCGALSEQLLESTLFGYEKGAFTGADKATPGCLEEAHGGTLFLDEIADMSSKLQSSLLRVLQERSFTRLGSTKVRNSDFRLICATNKLLIDEINEGRFRDDLYYRINVIAVSLPPLRERKVDIVPLALHFLEHYNMKFDKEVGPFVPEAIEVFEGLAWPGNVRQLQHAVERIVALHPGGPISGKDISSLVKESGGEQLSLQIHTNYQDAKDVFERDYFSRLLDLTEGNVSKAARMAGMSRQNFYDRMRKIGLSDKPHTCQ